MRLSSSIIIFCLFFVLIGFAQIVKDETKEERRMIEQRAEADQQPSTVRNASTAIKYGTHKYAGNTKPAFSIEEHKYDGVKGKVKRDAAKEAREKVTIALKGMESPNEKNPRVEIAYSNAQDAVAAGTEFLVNSTDIFTSAERLNKEAERLYNECRKAPYDATKKAAADLADKAATAESKSAEEAFQKAADSLKMVKQTQKRADDEYADAERASENTQKLIEAAIEAFEKAGTSEADIFKLTFDGQKEYFESVRNDTKNAKYDYEKDKGAFDVAMKKNTAAKDAFEQSKKQKESAKAAFEVAEKEWKSATKQSTSKMPQTTQGPDEHQSPTQSGKLVRKHLILVIVLVSSQL